MRRNLNNLRMFKNVKMDMNRYEEDGKYAAEIDFKRSPEYLLGNVVSGFEALTESIMRGGNPIVGHGWEADYLEEGLKLSGFEEAFLLFRTDIAECVDVFAKGLERKARLENLKRGRGFGAAKGFGKDKRVGKRIPLVENRLKEQLGQGGKILFEKNDEFGHVSVIDLPDGSGGQTIKVNLFGDVNQPGFLQYVEEVKSLFPGAIEDLEII
jgi:hypothetical protein